MTCWKTENLKNLGKKSIWKICNGSLRETLSPSESRIDNMSILLLGNQPSKTMLALFRQTWHWELLFTWPSASTQNKALHSIHEPAPPVLFILGGVILPTSVRNGYFQADGRRFRKMWSRLMCRSHRDKASLTTCESYDGLASRVMPGDSNVHCLKTMRHLQILTEVKKSLCIDLAVFGWGFV